MLDAKLKPALSIQTEVVGLGGYMDFHLNTKVSDSTYEMHISLECHNKVYKSKPAFVSELFAIDGVTAVNLLQYSVRIEKAKLFDWKRIEPKVKEVLFKTFNK